NNASSSAFFGNVQAAPFPVGLALPRFCELRAWSSPAGCLAFFSVIAAIMPPFGGDLVLTCWRSGVRAEGRRRAIECLLGAKRPLILVAWFCYSRQSSWMVYDSSTQRAHWPGESVSGMWGQIARWYNVRSVNFHAASRIYAFGW